MGSLQHGDGGFGEQVGVRRRAEGLVIGDAEQIQAVVAGQVHPRQHPGQAGALGGGEVAEEDRFLDGLAKTAEEAVEAVTAAVVGDVVGDDQGLGGDGGGSGGWGVTGLTGEGWGF